MTESNSSAKHDLLSWMEDCLQSRRQENILRSARTTERVSPTCILLDGKGLVNFGANDYLGLSWNTNDGSNSRNCSRVIGSGAAPLLSGYGPSHAALEAMIAKFEGTEAAILFSTGYAANVGTVSCIAKEGDLILSDSLNHASLIDGCRLSKATTVIFPHNNMEGLRENVAEHRVAFDRAYLVTDTLFSMNGDLANLPAIVRIANEFDLIPIVDEAHATGVYGAKGRGWVEECGLEDSIPIRIGTLSKAVGVQGGFVAGSKTLVDYLRNFARTYVYSTSMPGWLATAAAENIRKLESMSAERAALRRTSHELRGTLQKLGYSVPSGDSPIIPVMLSDAKQAMELAAMLLDLGYYVPAIRPPTVPQDQCMIRISLSIHHCSEQLQGLVAALATNSMPS